MSVRDVILNVPAAVTKYPYHSALHASHGEKHENVTGRQVRSKDSNLR